MPCSVYTVVCDFCVVCVDVYVQLCMIAVYTCVRVYTVVYDCCVVCVDVYSCV